MNVLHVSPTFFPATYWGGPIFSTLGLCEALARRPGVLLRVLTTDSAGPGANDRVPPGAWRAPFEVRYCPKRFGADIAPGLFGRLPAAVRWADVVHLTGVYSPPTLPTLALCRLLGRPLVWSPRGSLQRWEGATRPAMKAAWERACNALLTSARTALHVTSDDEARASAGRMPRARPVVIANGVDIPAELPARDWRPGGRLRVLFLGRLHPIKAVDRLIAALAQPGMAQVDLCVAGGGDAHVLKLLREQVAALALAGQVRFLGPLEGEAKRAAFAMADVLVLPSHSENFGMVVAEALAHGVPVVASRGTPWERVGDVGCGLWVDNSPAALAEALRALGAANLESMGVRGRHWMSESFGWDLAAERMLAVYQGLAGAHAHPPAGAEAAR